MNFNEIKWSELATNKFWFGVDRLSIHLSDNLFLYAGLALLGLGILTLIYARFASNQFLSRVAMRAAKILVTIGLLEAFWYLLRIQYVQALGTRFTAMLILLAGVIWLYWPIKYLVSHYKVDMEKAERAASREKYLNKF
jgi:hypothetical protein